MIQIGIRGTTNDPDMWGFSQRSGMRVLPMDEFHDKGWRFAADEARRVVGSGPMYLSFDIDSLDPAQAPGTGTPEAGGISVLEALRLLRALRGVDFVGGDLVEVSPPFDVAGSPRSTGRRFCSRYCVWWWRRAGGGVGDHLLSGAPYHCISWTNGH